MATTKKIALIEYIGTKLVKAFPMKLSEYENYRGNGFKVDQKVYLENHPGYLIEYDNESRPNDSRHKGYISWSPKEVFDKSYKINSGLNFGQVLSILAEAKGCIKIRHGDMSDTVFISGIITTEKNNLLGGEKRSLKLKLTEGVNWSFYTDILVTDLLRNDYYVIN